MEKTRNDSLLKRILLFIFPLMLTGLLQLCYNAADSIIVGRYDGSEALAAVSSVGPLITLLVNFFLGLSVGSAVCISHDIGAKDYEGVSRTVHTSFCVSIILGIIVAAIGIFGSGTFLRWMGSPDDVIMLSKTYLIIYFIGTPANMVYNFLAAVLRSAGDTKHPLLFLSISGIVNVVLNIIFVVTLKLSVAGVALATIISQYLSAVFIITFMTKSEEAYRFRFGKLSIDFDKFKKILYVGFPAGLQSALFSLSNVVIQSSINSFGSTVMAGNGAASNLETFSYTPMNAVHHAALTFVGQNYGAGNINEIRKVMRRCLVIVTLIGLIFGISFTVFSNQLLSIYLPGDAEAISYGALRISIVVLPHFLCGIMDVFVGGQWGMGMSFIPMFNSLMGSCLFRIVWIMTVFAHYGTLESIFISYPISWLILSVTHMVFYFIQLKKIKKRKETYHNAS